MDSYSHDSISTISERIFDEEQYPDRELSNKPSNNRFRKKNKNNQQVFLEGYVEASDEDDLVRAKSLTDEDLNELKGCFDLGFGFSYDEIPELCNTLPALELCYSMSQKFHDEAQQKSPDVSPNTVEDSMDETGSPSPAPVANWKISSPEDRCYRLGYSLQYKSDDPEEVKARLKYWAQAVACTVKLCN